MQRYSHSGIIPLGGAVFTLVGSILLAIPLALVYMVIIHFIPFRYLHFLATMFFGLGLGFLVALLCRWGKIRNFAFCLFAWLVTLAFGYYVYWGASAWSRDGLQAVFSVFHPQAILAYSEELFDKGSFAVFGRAAVSGWWLVMFWAIELGMLIYFSYVIAVSNMDQPFCESCNEWTETEKGVAMFNATGSEPEWDKLKLGDYSALTRLPILTDKLKQYVRLDVEHCPQCGNSNFMNIYKVVVKVDDEGDESSDETKLVSNVILSHEQLTLVRELVDRAAEEAATSQGPVGIQESGD